MTGLFFGSFNPVHNGHIDIAHYLLSSEYCQEIWFVISPQNPWKEDHSLLEENKRFEILQAAISKEKKMKACDIEFKMLRPSYSFLTLKKLKKIFPEKEFALIIGGDNFKNFRLWKNYQEIINNFPILVYPRPGIDIPSPGWSNVTIVQAPLTNISSTEIREKIKRKEDITSYVPPTALTLILKYYLKYNP